MANGGPAALDFRQFCPFALPACLDDSTRASMGGGAAPCFNRALLRSLLATVEAGTPGKLEVSAIDVGQGDSIFVAFPDGTTMLVDAGGFPGFTNMVRKPQLDIGEDVVSPYLWKRRIRHIDYAVLTHGHSDH